MTSRHYTLTEVLELLPEIGRPQLDHYIRAGVVVPVQSQTGPLLRDLDIARLHLILDLTDGYHLDDEALALCCRWSISCTGCAATCAPCWTRWRASRSRPGCGSRRRSVRCGWWCAADLSPNRHRFAKPMSCAPGTSGES